MINTFDVMCVDTDTRLWYLVANLKGARQSLTFAVNRYFAETPFDARTLSADYEQWLGVKAAAERYDIALESLCHHIRTRYPGARTFIVVKDLLARVVNGGAS